MLGKDVNEGKKCARKRYPNIILFFFFGGKVLLEIDPNIILFFFWKSRIRNIFDLGHFNITILHGVHA